MSAEIAYVGNHSNRAFIGNGPAANYNDPTLVGYGTLNTNQRRPFFAGPIQGAPNGAEGDPGTFGAAFGWTQGHRLLLQLRHRPTTSPSRPSSRAGSRTAGRSSPSYTLPAREEQRRQLLLHRPEPELRARTRSSAPTTSWCPAWPSCRSARARSGPRMPAAFADALIGGWQVNTNIFVQSGLPFDVGYAGSGNDRDVGAEPSGRHRRHLGPKTKDEWFNATPIGSAGSAFGRAAGDLRRHGAQLADRPRLLGRGRLALQAVPHRRTRPGVPRGGREPLQPREPGSPTTPRSARRAMPEPNAGRITSTASAEPNQRNLQFGFRFLF